MSTSKIQLTEIIKLKSNTKVRANVSKPFFPPNIGTLAPSLPVPIYGSF